MKITNYEPMLSVKAIVEKIDGSSEYGTIERDQLILPIEGEYYNLIREVCNLNEINMVTLDYDPAFILFLYLEDEEIQFLQEKSQEYGLALENVGQWLLRLAHEQDMTIEEFCEQQKKDESQRGLEYERIGYILDGACFSYKYFHHNPYQDDKEDMYAFESEEEFEGIRHNEVFQKYFIPLYGNWKENYKDGRFKKFFEVCLCIRDAARGHYDRKSKLLGLPAPKGPTILFSTEDRLRKALTEGFIQLTDRFIAESYYHSFFLAPEGEGETALEICEKYAVENALYKWRKRSWKKLSDWQYGTAYKLANAFGHEWTCHVPSDEEWRDVIGDREISYELVNTLVQASINKNPYSGPLGVDSLLLIDDEGGRPILSQTTAGHRLSWEISLISEEKEKVDFTIHRRPEDGGDALWATVEGEDVFTKALHNNFSHRHVYDLQRCIGIVVGEEKAEAACAPLWDKLPLMVDWANNSYDECWVRTKHLVRDWVRTLPDGEEFTVEEATARLEMIVAESLATVEENREDYHTELNYRTDFASPQEAVGAILEEILPTGLIHKQDETHYRRTRGE